MCCVSTAGVLWRLKDFWDCLQAFAMAMHSCHAHCGPVQAAQQHPSWLPELISDFEPLLPSIDSVPLPGELRRLIRAPFCPTLTIRNISLPAQEDALHKKPQSSEAPGRLGRSLLGGPASLDGGFGGQTSQQNVSQKRGTFCSNKSPVAAVVKGTDFKTGVARAVPGWENVRLLAPHAELRLLACGQSALIDAQRLRCARLLSAPVSGPCACLRVAGLLSSHAWPLTYSTPLVCSAEARWLTIDAIYYEHLLSNSCKRGLWMKGYLFEVRKISLSQYCHEVLIVP